MAISQKSEAQIAAENEAYAKSLEKTLEKQLKGTINILLNQVVNTCQNIIIELSNIQKNVKLNRNLYKHEHAMHKHAILRGHDYGEYSNSTAISGSKSGEGGKNLGCFYPNVIPFTRLLNSEYASMSDKDDNGLVFFKDFYIDYLDPNAPLSIKSMLYNIYFPDARLFPYTDENGKDIKTDINFIYYHFKWVDETFSYITIKRSSPLQKMSWNQYLGTILKPL